MDLVLDLTPGKGRSVVFKGAGLRWTARIPRTAFVDGTAPRSIVVTSERFAEPKPKPPKVKLTAEERRQARANRPKPTAQEKIARMEARLAKAKAKLLQPSL